MNWKEITLLLVMAICVALVAATVIEAFEENRTTRGGLGSGADLYSVSIVKPTRTERPLLPTVVATGEPGASATPDDRAGQRGTPEPTATNDYSATGDF